MTTLEIVQQINYKLESIQNNINEIYGFIALIKQNEIAATSTAATWTAATWTDTPATTTWTETTPAAGE